jgi:hypothetical protein
MNKRELINHLKTKDPLDILTCTFYPLVEKKLVCIFSDGYEYIEVFADDGTIDIPQYIPQEEPTLIGEAIETLEKGNWEDDNPIILTLGNEENDVVSSRGGVEWRDGELYLNTETCSRQV